MKPQTVLTQAALEWTENPNAWETKNGVVRTSFTIYAIGALLFWCPSIGDTFEARAALDTKCQV
jgi:hypothetical protein